MKTTSLWITPVLCGAIALASCSSGSNGPDRGPVRDGDTRIASHSPYDGEEGVAITRESILRFDLPVDPASIHEKSIWVEAGGVRRAARIHVADDARGITLFYDSLQANTEHTVVFDGDHARSASTGRPVDADGDGKVGGQLRWSFRTLDLTIVPNTDLCGRVFASELEAKQRNVPLRGATIRALCE